MWHWKVFYLNLFKNTLPVCSFVLKSFSEQDPEAFGLLLSLKDQPSFKTPTVHPEKTRISVVSEHVPLAWATS